MVRCCCSPRLKVFFLSLIISLCFPGVEMIMSCRVLNYIHWYLRESGIDIFEWIWNFRTVPLNNFFKNPNVYLKTGSTESGGTNSWHACAENCNRRTTWTEFTILVQFYFVCTDVILFCMYQCNIILYVPM